MPQNQKSHPLERAPTPTPEVANPAATPDLSLDIGNLPQLFAEAKNQGGQAVEGLLTRLREISDINITSDSARAGLLTEVNVYIEKCQAELGRQAKNVGSVLAGSATAALNLVSAPAEASPATLAMRGGRVATETMREKGPEVAKQMLEALPVAAAVAVAAIATVWTVKKFIEMIGSIGSSVGGALDSWGKTFNFDLKKSLIGSAVLTGGLNALLHSGAIAKYVGGINFAKIGSKVEDMLKGGQTAAAALLLRESLSLDDTTRALAHKAKVDANTLESVKNHSYQDFVSGEASWYGELQTKLSEAAGHFGVQADKPAADPKELALREYLKAHKPNDPSVTVLEAVRIATGETGQVSAEQLSYDDHTKRHAEKIRTSLGFVHALAYEMARGAIKDAGTLHSQAVADLNKLCERMEKGELLTTKELSQIRSHTEKSWYIEALGDGALTIVSAGGYFVYRIVKEELVFAKNLLQYVLTGGGLESDSQLWEHYKETGLYVAAGLSLKEIFLSPDHKTLLERLAKAGTKSIFWPAWAGGLIGDGVRSIGQNASSLARKIQGTRIGSVSRVGNFLTAVDAVGQSIARFNMLTGVRQIWEGGKWLVHAAPVVAPVLSQAARSAGSRMIALGSAAKAGADRAILWSIGKILGTRIAAGAAGFAGGPVGFITTAGSLGWAAHDIYKLAFGPSEAEAATTEDLASLEKIILERLGEKRASVPADRFEVVGPAKAKIEELLKDGQLAAAEFAKLDLKEDFTVRIHRPGYAETEIWSLQKGQFSIELEPAAALPKAA